MNDHIGANIDYEPNRKQCRKVLKPGGRGFNAFHLGGDRVHHL
ncbi:uncharacterized protein METZ01_LOCUS410300 [marine metagenome]|uniref:Uncharacterized protein n=1 Tax=marine metagenome TaxID=408172 RepID=A0A382WEW9_9ZZZZ